MALNESLLAGASAYPDIFAVFFLMALILIALLVLLLFALWIWMLVDCAKREKFRTGDRVTWILLLVLVTPLGMILYYFMVMRKK